MVSNKDNTATDFASFSEKAKVNELLSDEMLAKAKKLGISCFHHHIDGSLIQAKPESVKHFVNILAKSKTQLNKSKGKNGCSFDDFLVVNEGDKLVLTAPVVKKLNYSLYDENNILLQNGRFSGLLELENLACGYFRLSCKNAGSSFNYFVIVSPRYSYQSPKMQQQAKQWGANIQLYTLVSQRNWGIGDFADLADLIKKLAAQGASFVGVNPLHALYLNDPESTSPYSPSSKKFLNYIYLALDKIVEFNDKTVQKWFNSAEIQQQLEQVRNLEFVDYKLVSQLKLEGLKLIFNAFKQINNDKRRRSFAQFVQAGGEALLNHASFDFINYEIDKEALLKQQPELSDFSLKNVAVTKFLAKNREKIDFYLFLQWCCDEQLSECKSLANQLMDIGIYGDMAVGSSSGGSDLWSNQSDYLAKSSIGAPPDPLGPVGQNWHLPVPNPQAMISSGFSDFIQTLRKNMCYFGAVRIDHVMGLYRLWCIPAYKNADSGLYINFPAEALFAIVALESMRNQCVVIGEALGTVPPEVLQLLESYKMSAYKVLYFEQQDDGEFLAPNKFEQSAIAVISTHDLPPLQGFWHCCDLKLLYELNIFDKDRLNQAFNDRLKQKQAILNALHKYGFLAENYSLDASQMAMHDNLNKQIHLYLAQSSSLLCGIQLEDLLFMESPVNIPGTDKQYPNWRRKLSASLDQIFGNNNIIALLTELDRVRQGDI